MLKINSLKKRLADYWNSNDSPNNSENEGNLLRISKNLLVKVKGLVKSFTEQFYNNDEGYPSFWFIVSVYLFGRLAVGELFFPDTTLAMYIGFAFVGLAVFISIAYLPKKSDSSQEEKEVPMTCVVTSVENKTLVDSIAPKISLCHSDRKWISKVGARISITEKKRNLWMSLSFALNVTRFDPPPKNKYDPDQVPSLVPHGLQDANAAKSLLKQTDMSLSENTRGAVLWIHEPVKSYTSKEWDTYKITLSSKINNRYYELNKAITTLFPRFEFIPYSPELEEEPEKSLLAMSDILEIKEKVDEIKKLDLGLIQDNEERSTSEIPTGGL
ncbi:MAG: hypothetical protein ACTSYA_13490 [Candidatus Kariarchaeaceae archaeon]